MTKYVLPATALLGMGLSMFSPQIQSLVADHPQISGVAAMVGMLASAFAPQPHK